MNLEAIQTLHLRVWQWLKGQVAQDVPEAVELCEFDCREPQCNEEEWATCERRIQHAAGELRPESAPCSPGNQTHALNPFRNAARSPDTEE